LKPLYDYWKRDSKTLPAIPLKLIHSFFPGFFASKKYKKTSTDGVWPKWLQRKEKALTNSQLLGCSWAGATLTSMRSARSNPMKGSRSLSLLKVVEYMKKKGSSGSARSSTHRFAFPVGQNLIVLPPKNVIFLVGLAFLIRLYVLKGVDLGGFC